jgi:hypothetical protein
MANLSIKYVVDSIEGNALSTTIDSENSGWVEYCNQHGTLFWGTVTQDWLQSNKNTVLSTITQYALASDKKNLGFINHLANTALNDNFVMPFFSVADNAGNIKLTCGHARLAASLLNGRESDELKIVVFVFKGGTTPAIQNAKPLLTTAEFEQIFDLQDIDYEISMLDCAEGNGTELEFTRAVLKYSIYDKKDQTLPHTAIGHALISFWDRHVKNERIHLNVRCTAAAAKLIQPSELFKTHITVEPDNEWQWSFGKILGAYRKNEGPNLFDKIQINLWLYDVTEPVNLELLLPWMGGQFSACHSKNKKALCFDTSTDPTSIAIVGDWCQ